MTQEPDGPQDGLQDGLQDGPRDRPATCSAKGCQAPATYELRWNNPKLHTPDRIKIWLACEDHRQSLSDFLAARKFLREVAPH